MRYILYLIFAQLAGLLPLKVLHGLGDGLGGLIWIFSSSRRKYSIQAVGQRLELPRKQARTIARKSFLHSGRSFLEILYSEDDYRFLYKNISVPDMQIVNSMRHTARPIVFACAHFGAWELLSSVIVLLMQEKTGKGVVRLPKDKNLAEIMLHLRSKSRIKMVPHRHAAPEILRHLRGGGLAGFLADHNCSHSEALFLPFLGKKAAVNIGPALLAVRSEAIVWPVFLLRLPGQKYRLISARPQDTRTLNGNRREKIEKCAEYYTNAIAEMVKQHPEQWFWMHKRWKTRPEQETSENL